eukprot:gnl/Chilomastix_cuspidata/3104.p1 GENE.gnl/Chilomastix_cuspidata/3104~~gnl/Chilomastix_cuspidata/3104.p1  ORF type:complete len:883 (+),score=348.84 gnl/Chilomastix_cuspidata/3104:261-2909(+)
MILTLQKGPKYYLVFFSSWRLAREAPKKSVETRQMSMPLLHTETASYFEMEIGSTDLPILMAACRTTARVLTARDRRIFVFRAEHEQFRLEVRTDIPGPGGWFEGADEADPIDRVAICARTVAVAYRSGVVAAFGFVTESSITSAPALSRVIEGLTGRVSSFVTLSGNFPILHVKVSGKYHNVRLFSLERGTGANVVAVLLIPPPPGGACAGATRLLTVRTDSARCSLIETGATLAQGPIPRCRQVVAAGSIIAMRSETGISIYSLPPLAGVPGVPGDPGPHSVHADALKFKALTSFRVMGLEGIALSHSSVFLFHTTQPDLVSELVLASSMGRQTALPYSLEQNGAVGARPGPEFIGSMLVRIPPLSGMLYETLRFFQKNPHLATAKHDVAVAIAASARASREVARPACERASLYEVERYALFSIGTDAANEMDAEERARALGCSCYPASACLSAVPPGHMLSYAKIVFGDAAVAAQVLCEASACRIVRTAFEESGKDASVLLDLPGWRYVPSLRAALGPDINSLDTAFVFEIVRDGETDSLLKIQFDDLIDALVLRPRLLVEADEPFLARIAEARPAAVASAMLSLIFTDSAYDFFLGQIAPARRSVFVLLCWEAALGSVAVALDGGAEAPPAHCELTRITETLVYVMAEIVAQGADTEPVVPFSGPLLLPSFLSPGQGASRGEAILACLYALARRDSAAAARAFKCVEELPEELEAASLFVSSMLPGGLSKEKLEAIVARSPQAATHLVRDISQQLAPADMRALIRRLFGTVLDLDTAAGEASLPNLLMCIQEVSSIPFGGQLLGFHDLVELLPERTPLAPVLDTLRSRFWRTVSSAVDGYLILDTKGDARTAKAAKARLLAQLAGRGAVAVCPLDDEK